MCSSDLNVDHKCKICNTNFASDEEVKEHILIHRECCPFPACSKVTHCHHRDGMYADLSGCENLRVYYFKT